MSGLLLSTFVTDDALIVAIGRARSRLGRISLLLLAFLHQQLMAEHFPDGLFRLRFGFCWNLLMAASCMKNDVDGNVPPIDFDLQVARSAPLEAGSTRWNNPVAEQT